MKPGNERPINGTAARVMARGEHFEFQAQSWSSDSCMPLPTKPVAPNMLLNGDFTDLTGQVIGRLTVIGLSAEKSRKWVCRCICGTYVLRQAKGIKSGSSASAPCDQCYMLAVAKSRDYFRRTGKQLGTEECLK